MAPTSSPPAVVLPLIQLYERPLTFFLPQIFFSSFAFVRSLFISRLLFPFFPTPLCCPVIGTPCLALVHSVSRLANFANIQFNLVRWICQWVAFHRNAFSHPCNFFHFFSNISNNIKSNRTHFINLLNGANSQFSFIERTNLLLPNVFESRWNLFRTLSNMFERVKNQLGLVRTCLTVFRTGLNMIERVQIC